MTDFHNLSKEKGQQNIYVKKVYTWIYNQFARRPPNVLGG